MPLGNSLAGNSSDSNTSPYNDCYISLFTFGGVVELFLKTLGSIVYQDNKALLNPEARVESSAASGKDVGCP